MTSLPLQRIVPEVLLDVAGRDGNDVVEVLRGGGGAHDRERYDDYVLVEDRAQVTQIGLRAVGPGSAAGSSPPLCTLNCDELVKNSPAQFPAHPGHRDASRYVRHFSGCRLRR